MSIGGGFPAYLNGNTSLYSDIDIFIISEATNPIYINPNFWRARDSEYIGTNQLFYKKVYDVKEDNPYVVHIKQQFDIKHFPQIILLEFDNNYGIDYHITCVLNTFDLLVCRTAIGLIPKTL